MRDAVSHVLVLGLAVAFFTPSTLRAQSSTNSSSSREVESAPLLRKGEFELGADLALLWSVDTNSPKGQKTVSTSSYYGDLGAHAGLMLQDKMEARLHAGWLRVSVIDDEQTLQKTDALILAFQLLFHGPINDQLALFAGPGIGGYLGQTNRDVDVGGQSLDAENATNGLLGQLLTGVLIELGPYVALRTGLRLDGLVGREIPSEGTDLVRRNTQNVKLLGIFEVSGKL